MFDNLLFWRANQALICALYVAGAILAATGQAGHIVARTAAIVPLIHLLEIPLAMRVLKEQKPAMARLLVGTLLFGLFWWVPARRGLVQVA